MVVVLATAARPAPATAQTEEALDLDLGGYVRALTAVQDLGYEAPAAERRSAFHGEVVRLKWLVSAGGHIRLTVHNRIQAQVTSTTQGFGTGVVGFGVSAVPNRTVSLSTTVLEEDQFRIVHDLDRLALDIYTDAVDLTIGRQAISWGISNLFPIADLWAQFSPFELDTEEKRGIDAVRALSYPTSGVELDMVIADRGTLRDLSGGARATIQLPWADVYVGGGKFWRRLIALGGASIVFDTWKLRGEIGLPWHIDSTGVEPIRATVGVDHLGTDYQLSIEYHHNGLGANDSDAYVSRLTASEFQRGETYFLGRHYLGASGNYLATDRLSLSLGVLANLGDPSTTISPVATYDMGQHTRLSAGGLIALGETPLLTMTPPQLRSEFGAYGRLGYTRISVFF